MRNICKLWIIGLALLMPGVSYAANNPPVVVALAKQAGITEEQARKQIDQVMVAIKSEMVEGREVTVRNFGKFYIQQRDARTGRNPRTGAAIEIPAKRYPRFTSADGFKKDMNPSQPAEALVENSIDVEESAKS